MKSSKPKTEVVEKLTPQQKRVASALEPAIKSGIKQGATPYSGQLTAGIPTSLQEAYKWLSGQFPMTADVARQALLADISATPAWQWNEQASARRWERDFAVPAMETWQRTVAPLIKEQYAGVPGGLYSRERASGVGRAATDYYGQYIQPTLFQAQEAEQQRAFLSAEQAAARRLPAATQYAQLPYQQFTGMAGASDLMRGYEQQALSAQYQEFLRTAAEYNPWITSGIQFMGVPATQVVGYQGQESPWGTAALGAIGGALAYGGLQGAGLGTLLALSDIRYKRNVRPIKNCLDKVNQLRAVLFEYTEKPDDQRAGLVAQDVEKVLPEAVFETSGKKFVDYTAIIGLLVGAVNELVDKLQKGN